jgi:hypothetical protein
MKNLLKKIFKSEAHAPKDEFERLYQKWVKNPLVSEWEKKGWLKEERPEVLSYMVHEWERRNEPVPPPNSFKAETVTRYGKKYNYEVLIETGTFRGRMIDAQKHNYKKIMSIEIDKQFHADAVEKFKAYPHIRCCLGDSGKLLKEIIGDIDKPAILWLDAHYNGKSEEKLETECPIFGEIDAVFGSGNLKHVMLIDDARLFVGKNDYPTVPELIDYIKKKHPSYSVEVSNDIIRVEPAK